MPIALRDLSRPFSFSRSAEPNIFVGETHPVSDSDDLQTLLTLVATGQLNVEVDQDPVRRRVFGALKGGFQGQLHKWASLFELGEHDFPEDATGRHTVKTTIYHRGLLKGPDEKLLIVCSKSPGPPLFAHSQALVEAATEAHTRTDKSDGGDTFNFSPYIGDLHAGFLLPNPVPDEPAILETLIREVLVYKPTLGDPRERSAPASPRDGEFYVMECAPRSITDKDPQVLVSWSEYTGGPVYGDIRWSAQQTCPTGFAQPRRNNIETPDNSQVTEVLMPSAPPEDRADEYAGVDLDDRRFNERIAESHEERRQYGFETVAWYQQHHIWDESTWGIYLLAEKVDNFALSIFQALRARSVPNAWPVACLLATGLLYQHELFHARVEAATTWLELLFRAPKHSPYNRQVYRETFLTSACLEEALANWWSWNWFTCIRPEDLGVPASKIRDIATVVEAELDMSPPGYCDWRLGDDIRTWREFSGQLLAGQRQSSEISNSAATESILLGTLPFAFELSDVPLYFIGQGAIQNAASTNPSRLNTITRREAEDVLKRVKCSKKGSQGKGSHQKWECPEGRCFQLPHQKTLTNGVFESFYKFLNCSTKAEYIERFRKAS